MKHISNFLSQSLNRTGVKKQVQTALVMQDLEKILLDVFGQNISSKIKPLYLKNNIITIACLSSVMSQEISFQKQEILKRLNNKYDYQIVTDLRIIL